jgi:hypothetical protein
MRDPFEESLRDMLNTQSSHDDDACLDRVLKTANRQVGAGDLFGLLGHWLHVVSSVAGSSARHAAPVSRRYSPVSSVDKAD